MPLGATIFLNGSEEIFQQGDHGSTFAPNPVSLAGGEVVVTHIDQLLGDIVEKGAFFADAIIPVPKIKEIRHKGLMIAIELFNEDPHLRDKALEAGLLINVIKDKTIRLLPALNITFEEIRIITEKLNELLK